MNKLHRFFYSLGLNDVQVVAAVQAVQTANISGIKTQLSAGGVAGDAIQGATNQALDIFEGYEVHHHRQETAEAFHTDNRAQHEGQTTTLATISEGVAEFDSGHINRNTQIVGALVVLILLLASYFYVKNRLDPQLDAIEKYATQASVGAWTKDGDGRWISAATLAGGNYSRLSEMATRGEQMEDLATTTAPLATKADLAGLKRNIDDTHLIVVKALTRVKKRRVPIRDANDKITGYDDRETRIVIKPAESWQLRGFKATVARVQATAVKTNATSLMCGGTSFCSAAQYCDTSISKPTCKTKVCIINANKCTGKQFFTCMLDGSNLANKWGSGLACTKGCDATTNACKP